MATAEDIAKQWKKELGPPHTTQARARGELLEYVYNDEVVGYVDYHLRRDRQLTIYQIAVAGGEQGYGYGKHMLRLLRQMHQPASIVAKCVGGSAANGFFLHLGFVLERVEEGKRRRLNCYRLQCST